MAWERGYYYRVGKEGGRVVRRYFGKGDLAELAAKADALRREQRFLKALTLRAEKDELGALDADIVELIEMTDLVARAALVAAGFRQHHRGEWRKRREQD